MDTLVVNLEQRKQVCLRCGTEERFPSNLTGELLAAMDTFREKHTNCLAVPQPEHSVPSINATKPFKPGDVVEYCGEEAVVVENFGSSGVVRLVPEGRMTWYWVFQGTPVTLVRAASDSVFQPGDVVEFCGDQATVIENFGTEVQASLSFRIKSV